jgi:hypothetical protein
MAHSDDSHRAAFLEPALAGLLDAIEDSVPVVGYLHWTLLDNFEWIFGYGVRLGLHEVDRKTFAAGPSRARPCTPRPCAPTRSAAAEDRGRRPPLRRDHRRAATQRNVFRKVTALVRGSWNWARARCRTSRTACPPADWVARAPPAEHSRPRTASSIEAYRQ